MKSLRFLLISILISAGLSGVMPAAESAPSAPKSAALQLRVEAPFVFNALYDDDIAEALYWQVKHALTARDKTLHIDQVTRGDGDGSRPLVNVTLLQWRINRMGDIECRFMAEYRTADGTQSLGTFEGTTASIVRSRAFPARDFEKAAEEAGRQLRNALNERGLL